MQTIPLGLRKLNITLIVFALFTLNSCNGQAKDKDDCVLHLKNARKSFNSYYQNNEDSALISALNEVEKSMQCIETRRGAVELKLSLLMLLKKYPEGYKYIDSLTENDFKLSYKKTLAYNYFLASEYESKGDTVMRNKLLNETVSNIQKYIQGENMPDHKINEEAYYDLFLIKSKILTQEQMNVEIALLKRKYPKNKDFFDALEDSFNESPKVGYIESE